jgi:hypothetical protein
MEIHEKCRSNAVKEGILDLRAGRSRGHAAWIDEGRRFDKHVAPAADPRAGCRDVPARREIVRPPMSLAADRTLRQGTCAGRWPAMLHARAALLHSVVI